MKNESLNYIAGRIYNEAFQEAQRQLEDSKTLASNPYGFKLDNFQRVPHDTTIYKRLFNADD
jgi:hypothetical protein